jgi:predicted TIM-barrel fold metal-dependent hydrolase
MIDHHAHPFSSEPGPFDPTAVTLDLLGDDAMEERHRVEGPARLMQELLTVRLARRLGCSPEDVSQARAEAGREWGAYVSGLFRDASIDGVIMDIGLGTNADVTLQQCAELAGASMHPIHRIEPSVDRLIGSGAGAAEVVEGVLAEMRSAVERGAVGFKTIIAYRTGLGVDPSVDLARADASLRSDAPVRRRGKACRDLVMTRALAFAAETGRPFQFHTGLGDSDIRLADSNPLLLEELLRSDEGRATPIVLIHGAYPWHEEVAFLATTKANVHVDLSLSNIFAPLFVADRLARILELAPATKVLLGTDGHGQPETFWFAATLLREAWQEVLSRMAAAGARDSWLQDAEERVFERNARELYRL